MIIGCFVILHTSVNPKCADKSSEAQINSNVNIDDIICVRNIELLPWLSVSLSAVCVGAVLMLLSTSLFP